uniref:Abnormal spindle-like microcephaly-associated protein ASH domain-containing protein n=1 Tax=Ixodes ricinus TaxID=34613 RepID=A0A131Y7J1_IXORI
MSRDRTMVHTMTFSPPSKRDDTASKPVTAKTEVLLLQPFSRAPQLCFDDISVGTEASRSVKVCNTSVVEHTVFIERVPRNKGFSVNADVFKVAPRGHETLNVKWIPADNDASCRVTINVRSDQGYKGGLVVLATVKKSVKRAPRQPQKSRTKVLTQSQQLNLPLSVKGAAPAPAHTKKRNVTVPLEFKLKTKTLHGCRTKPVFARPAEKSTPVRKAQQTAKTADEGSDLVRRESYVCVAAHDAVLTAAAAAVGEFDDSLDAEGASTIDKEIRDSTFTPPSSPQDNERAIVCKGDTFNSDPDFSARMEEFYEKVLQHLDPNADPMKSPSHHDFSLRMQERYEKALSRCPCESGSFAAVGPEEHQDSTLGRKLSTPTLPDIGDVVAQLDQGLNLGGDANDSVTSSLLDIIRKYADDDDEPLRLEEFFPADVSSIYGSP